MASKRARIVLSLANDRLAGNTSAGARVYRGRLRFDSKHDTFPAISLVTGDSEVLSRSTKKETTILPIDIVCVFPARLENPGDYAELMFEEIKLAVFTGGFDGYSDFGTDRAKLSRLGESEIAHDEIGDYLYAAVRAQLEYHEVIGNP